MALSGLTPTELHEEYVRKVRSVGEYIIKHADSIIGHEPGLNHINITIDIDHFVSEPPCLTITKTNYTK